LREGPSADYSHLHVHSGFSYGTATPEELVEAAAGMGFGALALTDRDGLYGVPRFLEVCERSGLSPIVGAEVAIEGSGHVVLLADSMASYRSLCRLITAYRTCST
jgi:error-prone DNA polymerase